MSDPCIGELVLFKRIHEKVPIPRHMDQTVAVKEDSRFSQTTYIKLLNGFILVVGCLWVCNHFNLKCQSSIINLIYKLSWRSVCFGKRCLKRFRASLALFCSLSIFGPHPLCFHRKDDARGLDIGNYQLSGVCVPHHRTYFWRCQKA